MEQEMESLLILLQHQRLKLKQLDKQFNRSINKAELVSFDYYR